MSRGLGDVYKRQVNCHRIQICVRYFKLFPVGCDLDIALLYPSIQCIVVLIRFAVGNDSLSSGLGFVLVECFIYTDHIICIVAFDDTVIILAILQLCCFFRYFISKRTGIVIVFLRSGSKGCLGRGQIRNLRGGIAVGTARCARA